MHLRTTVLACVALLTSATVVAAQPAAGPSAAPAPAPQPGMAPSPEPELPPTKAQQILQRFTFGVHFFTGGMNTEAPGRSADMTGYGAFVRFRFNERWEAELAARKMSGTLENRAGRELRPLTAGVLAHLLDFYGVDVYGRIGLGTAGETIRPVSGPPFTKDNLILHIGAGAHYQVWNNIGVSGEFRLARSSRRTDRVDDELVTSGAQYNLGVSYHF